MLSALHSALDPTTSRRLGWRKTNAELQFGERCALPPGATIYSIGCGQIEERDFFQELSQHSVTLLWDMRPPEDVREALRAGTTAMHFHGEVLRERCRGRMRFRSWPLGSRGVGGLTQHLHVSEEGACMIWRLHEAALQETICIVGGQESWEQDDTRISVSALLKERGVQVVHLKVGSIKELHPVDFELPIHLQIPSGNLMQDLDVADGEHREIHDCCENEDSATLFQGPVRWKRRAQASMPNTLEQVAGVEEEISPLSSVPCGRWSRRATTQQNCETEMQCTVTP